MRPKRLFRAQEPGVASFASLASAQQLEYLRTVDDTPFFDTTRLLTLLGMFPLPVFGGNRKGVGWKLIGRGQPTMTIQALAFRAGENSARFARRGEI